MWLRNFVWKCFPVLPLVYDDTLSFYEVISKMGKKINEIINSLSEMKKVVDRNSDAVLSVNNTEPDDNGNINLPQVSGVTSVCGVGADSSGNVQVSADNVGAISKAQSIIQSEALTIDETNTQHGYAYITFNGMGCEVNFAARFAGSGISVIHNIFNTPNQFGVILAKLGGNPLGLSTTSYASDAPSVNQLFCHCYTLPPTWGSEAVAVGYLEAYLMYDGTDTVLICTGEEVEDYMTVLVGREIKGNGYILRSIT